MTLPGDADERKKTPMATGLLDYFPDALAEVARCSLIANEQHNPGEHLHWAKHKSTDEADALMRHLVDRGKIDKDGVRHSAKVAWRALALLQRELEATTMAYTYTTPQRLFKDSGYCGVCGMGFSDYESCFDPRCLNR
jgi:hypothetical protein